MKIFSCLYKPFVLYFYQMQRLKTEARRTARALWDESGGQGDLDDSDGGNLVGTGTHSLAGNNTLSSDVYRS